MYFFLDNAKKSISIRLLIYILAFSSLVTLVTTAINLYVDYSIEMDQIEGRIQDIQQSSLHSLSHSLWYLDKKSTETQLDGILRLPDIQYLKITSTKQQNSFSVGSLPTQTFLSYEFPLIYRSDEREFDMGSFRVVVNLNNVYERLFKKILVILGTQALKTFLVSGFIFFIVQWLITRHLIKISDHVRQLDIQRLGQPLNLTQPEQENNELSHVADAINTMRGDLHQKMDALRKREARYEELYEDASDMYVSVDHNTAVITKCNYTLGNKTGYTKEEIVGQPFFILCHPDSMDDVKEVFQTFLETGKIHNAQFQLKRKNGNKIDVMANVSAVRDEQGQILYSKLSLRDITEIKTAENETLRNKLQLQAILDYSPALISIKDMEGTIILANRYFNVLDIPPLEEFIGKNVFELFPKKVAEKLWNNDLAALKSDRPIEAEEVVSHKDGSLHTYLTIKFPVYDETKKTIGICAISTDITDRKRAEKALTLNEELLRLSTEMVGVAVWEYDLANDQVERSANHDSLYGLEKQNVWGIDTYLNATYPEDRDLSNNITQNSIRPGGPDNYTFDFRVIWPDKSVHWLSVTGVISDRDKNGVATKVRGCLIDVTDRKLSEEENQLLLEKLQQAQKMESIGTLAGGIAHDFNNLLSVILGYAEMAKDNCQPGSSIFKDLDEVLGAGNRAKGLVQQILAFSRQDDMERMFLQPASIVKETITMLRPSLPTTIDITQDIDTVTGLVFVDPTQLNQILMNLCTNAFHAMEETGGKLDISLKEVTLSNEDLVHEPDVTNGTFIQLSISDSGTGIAPTVKDKIFDPYFTTKETGKGTGMGLSMVHGIVKNYGGFISLYSELGEGTVFHVFLPVVEKEAETEYEINDQIPIGRERVLFVDDEEILTKMGKAMLERLGYHVTVRNSSLKALETFQNQPDKFDIVITDQTMPGMTGSDLSRRMLEIRPDIPIILCTGYSTIISEGKAKAMGIKEFAFKPLAKKDMAKLIRKVLDVS